MIQLFDILNAKVGSLIEISSNKIKGKKNFKRKSAMSNTIWSGRMHQKSCIHDRRIY